MQIDALGGIFFAESALLLLLYRVPHHLSMVFRPHRTDGRKVDRQCDFRGGANCQIPHIIQYHPLVLFAGSIGRHEHHVGRCRRLIGDRHNDAAFTAFRAELHAVDTVLHVGIGNGITSLPPLSVPVWKKVCAGCTPIIFYGHSGKINGRSVVIPDFTLRPLPCFNCNEALGASWLCWYISFQPTARADGALTTVAAKICPADDLLTEKNCLNRSKPECFRLHRKSESI